MPSTLTMAESNALLAGVSFEMYDRLVEEVTNRTSSHYDDGKLEIVRPSQKHESWTRFVDHMIVEMCMSRRVPIQAGGSTTLRSHEKKRGAEPDVCYWEKSQCLIGGRLDPDFDVDPTPDLVLDRLGIFASLDVGEVWRYDGRRLIILVLDESHRYVESSTGGCFPWLPVEGSAAQIPVRVLAMIRAGEGPAAPIPPAKAGALIFSNRTVTDPRCGA